MLRFLMVTLSLTASLYGQAITGNDKFDRGEYAEAAATFEKVPEVERNAAVMNRLGISHHMLNRLRDAENAYKAAIRLDSRDSAAHNNLGALYYSLKKFGDAEREFRRGMEQDPENWLMRRNLRAAKYARENGRRAREVASALPAEKQLLILQRDADRLEVQILMPSNIVETASTHEKRGDSFMARKMYDDAILEYKKSIGLDRYNSSTLNRLGLAYHFSQRVSEGQRYYREALKLNPYYIEAQNNLGTVEYQRGRYRQALDAYGKALKIRPDSPTILQNVGACLFALERFEEGFKVYQRALEIDPQLFNKTSNFGTLVQTTQRNEPVMNFYLAKIFAGNGDKDRAISYLYKAVEEGFKDAEMIKTEPAFAILAEDDRFQKLMEIIATSEPVSK